ncbi:uncharacterized protein A1O5_01275 [Cladophialophora psammophila CBS 110553]|uniref:Uncharacterized protein n=1 Tax=Cladophialophora psammophila CBS 110553 TaxID=1182543 RepID=W9X8G5_9EURO|nr:uncharacterized protein A1O5_01275 [Cladophialophora psammophila CBS 110553]EXJ76767.1 hypothetical protein A1O5_01275 [Cladophialophora psammophila CBS 110553]
MAETAAIASIVGIASFGIQLTGALYHFGSNVTSAREETSYIARHVDLYANVLDLLMERIEQDKPEPLPPVKRPKDGVAFIQKLKWNFTKPKVALLVRELDHLRSIVHLLVTIIFTGSKIRSYRPDLLQLWTAVDNLEPKDSDEQAEAAVEQRSIASSRLIEYNHSVASLALPHRDNAPTASSSEETRHATQIGSQSPSYPPWKGMLDFSVEQLVDDPWKDVHNGLSRPSPNTPITLYLTEKVDLYREIPRCIKETLYSLQNLNISLPRQKRAWADKEFEKLAAAMWYLIDQNTGLKKEVAIAERRLIFRGERIVT